MIDGDRFKAINDTYGHDGGDAVLVALTATLQRALRTTDVLGRIGGEEFVVLLPNCTAVGAQRAAVTILEAIRTLSIPHAKSEHARVTVSIGVYTVIPARNAQAAALLASADLALYSAKQSGRDRVAVHQELEQSNAHSPS